jgi:hypothetical protein
VKKVLPMGKISEFEKKILDELIPQLQKSIDKGIDFARNQK